ncbi:MAG: xanthine dehydrogenase family protein molybdopterin-binding subunit [Andreesenia angusta]|nr:xanthine dehydrogenase family protein molybdopterin-binding subunit [Andreesenia angusta]
MDKYDSVGKRIFRIDAKSKVKGETIYPQDIYMDNMAYGKTLRSSIPHGKINKIDIEKAEKVEGVLKVFTAKDIPGKNHHGVLLKDHEAFCEKKVRRIGDPLAFVVAETEEIAEEALKLIEVDIEELEGVFSAEEGMKKDSPRVHDEEDNLMYTYNLKKGDIDSGFKESDIIVENEYRVGMVDHAFLQPEAGIAYMENGRIVVSVSSQYPHFDRMEIAEALDISEDRIKYLNPAVGGAFGAREDITMQIHLALATYILNRPVKTIYNREESFLAHSKRHSVVMKYKTGASKDGKLKALKAEFIGDTGAYASWAYNVMRKCGVHGTGPYEIPNVDIKSHAVYTNNPFAGAMRGFGATQPPVGHEQQMDILAEKLGIDPIDFRMKNIFKLGSNTATGQELSESVPLDRCIESVKEYIEKEIKSEEFKDKENIGVGYGATFYGTGYGNGFPDVSVAEAELNKDGKVNIYLEATECGQGSDTVMVQMAAEPFKSGIEIINHRHCNTDLTKDTGTAAASRQTYNSGNAVKLASEKLRDKLLEKASVYLGLNTSMGLDIKDNYIFLKFEKDRKISLKELAEKIYSEDDCEGLLREEAVFIAQTTMMSEEDGQGSPYWPYTFGACGVILEVDPLTGRVQILRAVSAQDVGKAINPDLIEGQMDGGFAMGYGYAIYEDLNIKNGNMKNNRFTNYLIPTSSDMPKLKKIIIEDPESTGPYGAKGIGEPVMTYVAPAILNAIYDAVGVRINSLPASPDKILKAISNKKEDKDEVESYDKSEEKSRFVI